MDECKVELILQEQQRLTSDLFEYMGTINAHPSTAMIALARAATFVALSLTDNDWIEAKKLLMSLIEAMPETQRAIAQAANNKRDKENDTQTEYEEEIGAEQREESA